jgi:hypothetical protein
MVLIGDEAQVDARFIPFRDSSNLKMGARFALNVPQAHKSFWTHPMEVLGDVGMWNLILVRLEIVLVSVQDRCMVCTKRTVGLEIILDTPDGTPRW